MISVKALEHEYLEKGYKYQCFPLLKRMKRQAQQPAEADRLGRLSSIVVRT